MPNSRFQTSITNSNEFTLTFELVPGRGSRSSQHSRIMQLVQEMAGDGRVCAVSVTDNAGGHAMLAPGVVGQEIMAAGLDVISHFSCKDKNRNKMESLLFGWDRVGLRNLLVISGDYPQRGYCGHPKPVFDLDSVQTVDMICRLNAGESSLPTSFFIGVAISPFKLLEAEQHLQYKKLHRKVAAGAQYGITQLGFDARKYHEALLYCKTNDLPLPLLGNLFIPTMAVAKLMHDGKIPGCILPESLWQIMKQEAQQSDKGKKARLTRAAKQLSILKGMGYSGAHIGGPALTMVDIDYLLSTANTLQNDWQQLLADFNHWPDNGFYYFQQDTIKGLNTTEVTTNQAVEPPSLLYRFSAACHNLAFEPQGALFKPAQKTCALVEDNWLHGPFFALEHLSKFILYACRNCGDCTLAHYGYYCPQSGCAKYLLNGPCGGSQNGWCEVYPGKKKCHYVKAYKRLQGVGKQDEICQEFISPRDWSLNNTSSWLNFYGGRDNTKRKC